MASVTRWVSLFFAIYNNENLSNNIFFAKLRPNWQKINTKKLPKIYKTLPKWRILAKSGHTDCMDHQTHRGQDAAIFYFRSGSAASERTAPLRCSGARPRTPKWRPTTPTSTRKRGFDPTKLGPGIRIWTASRKHLKLICFLKKWANPRAFL